MPPLDKPVRFSLFLKWKWKIINLRGCVTFSPSIQSVWAAGSRRIIADVRGIRNQYLHRDSAFLELDPPRGVARIVQQGGTLGVSLAARWALKR